MGMLLAMTMAKQREMAEKAEKTASKPLEDKQVEKTEETVEMPSKGAAKATRKRKVSK